MVCEYNLLKAFFDEKNCNIEISGTPGSTVTIYTPSNLKAESYTPLKNKTIPSTGILIYPPTENGT